MNVRPMLAALASAVMLPALALAPAPASPRYGAFAARARPAPAFVSPAVRGVAADVAPIRNGRDLGRAPRSMQIHVGVLLRVQHEAELERLTLMQGQRGSAYYHRYLSSPQFTQYFAPSPATYAAVARRLQLAGFRIEQTFPNRAMIRAVATAGLAERYFRTEFHAVVQAHGRVAYANVAPAVMPAELASAVVSLSGLHSTVGVRFPLRLSPIVRSAARRAVVPTRLAYGLAAPRAAIASPPPKTSPITMTSPPPGPEPTELLENAMTDYVDVIGGYGAPVFATAYDFPTQHGYSGKGHTASSVIDSDYNDSDLKLDVTKFSIKHTGSETRVCTGPNGVGCRICSNVAPAAAGTATPGCDAEGESTLDALTIMSLAPAADFIEYLVPQLSDVGIEGAYERAVNDNVAETVNSSFGGCETDDPAFEYSSNYIALEGASEGITFSASTGDTGATNCGTYATNGAPQTEVNSSTPSSAYYFTAVGGTSFDPLKANGTNTSGCQAGPPSAGLCYTAEQSWLDGGGGASVFEPMPSWQTASVTAANAATPGNVPTTGRVTPDLAYTADGGPGFVGGTQGAGLIIYNTGNEQGSGGTSLSSPMFIALQTEINEVQNSRNGWVNPRLYQVNLKYPGYAFRDITTGTNNFYKGGTGFDATTGNGSPLGFELAGAE